MWFSVYFFHSGRRNIFLHSWFSVYSTTLRVFELNALLNELVSWEGMASWEGCGKRWSWPGRKFRRTWWAGRVTSMNIWKYIQNVDRKSLDDGIIGWHAYIVWSWIQIKTICVSALGSCNVMGQEFLTHYYFSNSLYINEFLTIYANRTHFQRNKVITVFNGHTSISGVSHGLIFSWVLKDLSY